MAQYDISFITSGAYELESKENGFTSEIKSAASDVKPFLIIPRDRRRVELHLQNVGTVPGDVFISRNKDSITRFVQGQGGIDVFVISPGETFHPGFPPQSDVYAFAFLAENADLRVYETIIRPYIHRSSI